MMINEKDSNGIVSHIALIREQANIFLENELRNSGMEGVLPAHGVVLQFLFRQAEPVSIRSIVQQVGRVKSTVTGMINTLEKYGYLEKFQSVEDARVVMVRLTAKAAAMQDSFWNIGQKLVEKVYDGMAQQDRETLVRLLLRVRKNLEA